MALLEGRRLARECCLFLAFLRPVVGHGEDQASNRAELILVAEPHWITAVIGLRITSTGFSLYLRLCVYLDSVHPQPGDQLSQSTADAGVSRVRGQVRFAFKLLLTMWRPTSDRYC